MFGVEDLRRLAKDNEIAMSALGIVDSHRALEDAAIALLSERTDLLAARDQELQQVRAENDRLVLKAHAAQRLYNDVASTTSDWQFRAEQAEAQVEALSARLRAVEALIERWADDDIFDHCAHELKAALSASTPVEKKEADSKQPEWGGYPLTWGDEG